MDGIDFITNYWFWGGLGLLVGSSFGVRNMVAGGCPFPVSVIAATCAIYGGFLGARSLYILIYYPELFTTDPVLAIAFWQSTGTWLGGPPAGVLGMAIVLIIAKRSVWEDGGSFIPGLVLAHIISRVGCVVNGCCYGSPTTMPWAVHSEALGCLVHPTALYSILCEIVVFITLQLLWRRQASRPFLFPAYGMMLSTHRFFTEMFRGGDAAPWIIPGLRTYQSVSVFIFIFSFSLFLIIKWKKKGLIASGIVLLSALTVIVSMRSNDERLFKEVSGNEETILVISRSGLDEGLDEWVKVKEKQGFHVKINAWEERPESFEISAWIKRFSRGVSHILIAGDCAAESDRGSAWDIPSIRGENSHGSYVSDSLYGDIDGDGVPDRPVGRFPARDKEQLRVLSAKSLKYRRANSGNTDFDVVIWAAAEPFYESAEKITQQVENKLGTGYLVRLLGSDPLNKQVPKTFMTLLERAPDLSIIAAHGSFRSVVSGNTPVPDLNENGEPDQAVSLTVEDLLNFKAPLSSGPLFMLSCETGKFNLKQSDGLSLSEAFLGMSGGPVCVIAASGTMTPDVNLMMAGELVDQMDIKHETVGNLLLQIQRAALLGEKKPGGPKTNMKSQGDEGVRSGDILMYNLIGDPTCGIRL